MHLAVIRVYVNACSSLREVKNISKSESPVIPTIFSPGYHPAAKGFRGQQHAFNCIIKWPKMKIAKAKLVITHVIMKNLL